LIDEGGALEQRMRTPGNIRVFPQDLGRKLFLEEAFRQPGSPAPETLYIHMP
jgi:hypothetical protein